MTAEAAVGELASFRGSKAHKLLLQIAFMGNTEVWPQAQERAIEHLAERSEEGLSDEISPLLRPYRNRFVRRAVAAALERLPCEERCIESVISYLERVSYGERNLEERDLVGETYPEVSGPIREEETATYLKLYSVLRSNGRTANEVLQKEHGIGSEAPSLFALTLLSKVKISEVCPALKNSKNLMTEPFREDILRGPRQELDAAIEYQGCR
jgi:hypothetical protein